MASLVALHQKEVRHKPNPDIIEGEVFRRIFQSSRRMVRRIKHGLPDDMKIAELFPERAQQFQWNEVNADEIVEAICEETGLTLNILRSERRSQSAARPRQLACWLMRKHTDLSLPQIGRKFGGRDHTTIMHACERIEALLEKDASMRELHRRVNERLGL